jgi:uncharacterized protein YgiM (DUF1202 family)
VSTGDTVPSALDTTAKNSPAVAVITPAPVPPTIAKPLAAKTSAANASGMVSAAPQKVAPSPVTTRNAETAAASTTTLRPAPLPTVAVPDTGVWEYAVAKTWVRVRSAPSIASEMLRMVDSAQRVRLGPPTNGWRPVRVGVDRGWVDPRLFTVVPAPKP